MHDATLPPRIWVVGPCGGGKSTVAADLAARLGIEATQVDDIHWRPGWTEAPLEEEQQDLAAVVARPAWVIDGNYGYLRRPHHDSVDLFVWLDLPLSVTFPRLFRRGLVRSLGKRACCNGNYESLWRTFFDRESLLLWALQTDKRRRQGFEAELRERPHVRLRTQGAIDRWLHTARPAVNAEARSSRS